MTGVWDMVSEQFASCNTCGELFDDCGGGAMRQTLKNRKFAATLNDDGDVVQECCDVCAQEIYDAVHLDDGTNHLTDAGASAVTS